MKIYNVIYFLTFPFVSFSQITFQEVLSLEKKSFEEIQAFMLEDYSIIDDFKEYYYFPIEECNPPEYHEDNCTWRCTSPNHLDVLRSRYPLDKVTFKKSSNMNYEVWLTCKSSFGENYSLQTQKAKTFIDVFEKTTWSKNNCQNELRYGTGSYEPRGIKIQFSDPNHWKSFKNSVAQNATFQGTWRLSENNPIELRYGIRRKIVNGQWKGIYIVLYEYVSTYHATISFDSYGVE